MALFKNIEDLAKYAPVFQSLNFAEMLPDIERAEKKYLVKEVGKEIYEEIELAYQGVDDEQNLSDGVAALLKQMRIPVAQFAVYLYAPKANVNVGSSGLTQDFSDGKKPAFPNDVAEMRQSYLDGGHEGLDDLVDFLLDHKVDYATWNDSTAHARIKSLFVNNAAEFQEVFNIDSKRRTYIALKAILKRHEGKAIRNITGTELYDELKTQIFEEDITEDNAILLGFIRAAVIHNTVASAINELSVRIDTDSGLSIIASNSSAPGNVRDNRSPAPDSTLSNLREQELLLAAEAIADLKTHLQENASDYPLYEADTIASTENLPEEEFTNDPDSGIFMP